MIGHEEYLNHIENNVRRYSTLLSLELEEFFELTFSPEIDFLEFAIVETVSGTNIMVYSMNNEGEEVCGGYGETCFSGSEKLMESIGIFALPENIDKKSLLNEHADLEEKEFDLIKEWFSKAFKRSGGDKFKLPCFLSLNDMPMLYDLKEEKWVSKQE